MSRALILTPKLRKGRALAPWLVAGLGALLAALAASGIAVPGMPMIAIGTLAAALTGAGTGGAWALSSAA